MPYKTIKEGDKYEVYKLDADGNPTGKSLGTHDSADDAKKQIAAIEANSDEEKSLVSKAGRVLNTRIAKRLIQAYKDFGDIISEAKLEITDDDEEAAKMYGMLRQNEVAYVTVSPNTGTQQCANCRFFKASEYDANGMLIGSHCAIVEPYPESILPTGYCNRWELSEPEVIEQAPIPVIIVDVDTGEEKAYQTPKPAKTLLKSDKSGVTFQRGADGLRLAMIYTSNGYEDRAEDYVTTKALEGYVEECWQGDEYVGKNILDFWHHPKLDIGDIIYADMHETFLFEMAKERNTPLAKVLWDYWEKSADDIDWAASHRFRVKRRDTHVFESIKKERTSILPRSAAANLLTFSGVVPMTKARDKMLDKILDFEGAADMLKTKGVQAVMEHLKAKGVEHKSVDVPATETPTPQADEYAVYMKAFPAVLEGMAELLESIEAIEAKEATREKGHDELVTLVKTFQTSLDKVNAQLTLAPRGSKATETLISKEQGDAVKADEPVEYDPTWAMWGQKVPNQKTGVNGNG